MQAVKNLTKLFICLWASFSHPLQAGWSTPIDINIPSRVEQNENVPQLAVDAAGNAVALWYGFDGVANNIQAVTYDFTSNTWSAPICLIPQSIAGRDAIDVKVGVDAAGNAVAVWQNFGSTASNIQAATYDFAAKVWSKPVYLISEMTSEQSAADPHLTVDAAGNAVAVWDYSDGTTYNIQAATYDFASQTWSLPKIISQAISIGGSMTSQVAVDAIGNAVAIWQTIDDAECSIQAATYDFASKVWSTPVNIVSTNLTDETLTLHQIVVDPAGNAIAIWQYSDRLAFNIQAAAYDFTSKVWSKPINLTPISINKQIAYFPQIAVDPAGNAVAVWQYFDGTVFNIQAATYDFTSKVWSMPVNLILPNIVGQDVFNNPQVAVDSAGNAIAVWEYSGRIISNLQVATYDFASKVWSEPTYLISPVLTDETPSFPQIKLDTVGNAVAIWRSTENVVANGFEKTIGKIQVEVNRITSTASLSAVVDLPPVSG